MTQTLPSHEAALKAGAVFEEIAGWQTPSHFGDPDREYRAACQASALFDLSSRGKTEPVGPESLSFLQNLCTNDVKTLPVGQSREAFLTTNKAKVIAHVFIGHYRLEHGNGVILDFVSGMSEKVYEHLNHYLISEQVEITDRTRAFAFLHLAGPHASTVVHKALGSSVDDLAELHHQTQAWQAGRVCHIRRHDSLGLPGFDVLAAWDDGPELWQTLLAAGAVPAGQKAYEILRIEAGTPEYGKDIDDNRAVMEVGRTQQAISYTKGCFLGQEPIVMARDRGHVNRMLMGLRIAPGGPAKPGARLFKDGNEVGQVTSSVVSPRLGQPIALAYVRRGFQEPGTVVRIEPESDGREAVVAALPLVK
jgi:folate-binding protein YgfZ